MTAAPTLPWGDRTAGIAGGDPRWTETLPHRVVPQEDEWLPGLLARCDEANGWPAGTVARLLCPRQTAGYRLASPAHFVTAAGLDLAYLATLLALPLGSVEATTWRQALSRLHGTLLSTGEVGRLLAPPFVFLVCSRCVAEHRLLARWLALPLLGSCPRHGVLLRRRCRCGADLHPFRRTALPFTCAECRRPWAALPAQRATSAQRAIDRRTLTLFTTLLDGGPALVADARRLLQAELYARGWDQFPDQAIGSVALPAGPRWARAPTEVVASLTVLNLSVEQLLAAGPAGHGQPRCRNHACALFDVPGVGNVHSAGRRQGVPESYCDDCGARFLGDRVYSAFDDAAACGAGTPHPKTIARAQRRLAIWRRQLEEVCVRLLAADAPIRVAHALRTAGIPRSPYLRARRLGLLAIAQHYRVLQSVLLPAVTPTASGPAGGHPAHRPQRRPGPAYFSDLDDSAWAAVQPFLPGAVAGTTTREVVNALLFILKWGCSWHPLPGDLPSYPTILAVVCDWQRAGSWEAIAAALRRHTWWPDLRRDAQETITSFDEQRRFLASLFARPDGPSGAEHVDRDTLSRERTVGKASAP